MGQTLSQAVSAYRTTQQVMENEQATHKLTSLLNIGGQLYAIKDPAVEQLATAVETRLEAIENKTIREAALEKAQNTAKFATEVTQGTDGQITVTYSDAQTTDVKRSATAAVNTQGNEQIALSGTTTEEALIEIAKAIAAEQIARANGDTTLSSTLIGSSSDASSANTIAAAKKYADEAVANLAGTDWENNAKKVQEIIEELENSDNANAWATAIDKLAGLGVKTPAVYYTQEEITAAKEGDEAYGKTTSDVKTPAVYNTVKDYVDAAVAAASSAASDAIAALDATVGSQTVASGKHVAVEVVEQNGVLTSLTVTEDDIASATDLTNLTNTVEEHSEVTAAALTDLNTRLEAVETNLGSTDLTTALATKANKAAITTGTVNNWTSLYTAGTETLTWSNTETTVYVPVSGQSL